MRRRRAEALVDVATPAEGTPTPGARRAQEAGLQAAPASAAPS